jgi:BirA family biotin operon repressor/biotin-[acetyl-CoA-carboxylase] ligase
MDDTILTEARLAAALGSRPLRFEVRAGSTNDLARAWAGEGAPSGAVVVAEEQHAGRGRFGRQWISPPGTALLFSVILRPPQDLKHVGRLTMAAAVSVAGVLEDLRPQRGEPVHLKWPNDVLIGAGKVAGILSEALWQGDRLDAAIVGIGLNVRVSFEGMALARTATSIESAFGVRVDRARLLARLLAHLDDWAAQAEGPALFDAWRARLSTLGQRVEVMTMDAAGAGEQNRAIAGLAADVDADGALLLRADDGTVHRIVAGDVTVTSQNAE